MMGEGKKAHKTAGAVSKFPAARGLWLALGLGLTCGLLAFCLQTANGVWNADLAFDPDEAAHAVTSLMVRDYLTDGVPSNPLAYAQTYYSHFPKVALGHYPPGYYITVAAGLLPFPQVHTLLALQAVFCGALGSLVFLLGRPLVGVFASWVAALLTVALPLVQKVSACVMSDLLMAVWCLWAALVWVRYMKEPTAKRALLFGLLAALAILTKGAGLLLAFVPGVAILLTGNFRLLTRLSLWMAALPVLLLAAPWMAFSLRYTQEGMASTRGMAYVMQAAPYYLFEIQNVLGIVLAVLLAGCVLRLLGDLLLWRAIPPETSVLWGVVFGTLFVAILVPAGLSTRYLLPACGPVILLVLAELRRTALQLTGEEPVEGQRTRLTSAVAAVALVPLVYWSIGLTAPKVASGFSQAVAEVRKSSPKDGRWLVSSDAKGEGAIIAAAAFDLPSRKGFPLTVYRGSKELAASDWMGRGYTQAFSSEAALRSHLDRLKVDWVLADESIPPTHLQSHHRQIVGALTGAAGWKLVKSVNITRGGGATGSMKLFHRTGAALARPRTS